MSARPTTLRLFVDRCPWAVQAYEDGVPTDVALYATGTSAHDVLDAIARHGPAPEVVDHVVGNLIAVGRTGIDASGPLHPDSVYAGRDLAVAYASLVGIPEGAIPELGLAFDRNWNPLPYESADAWFRVRLDLTFVVESDDEDVAATGIVVRDYKSGWNADAALLDSIQMRSQAVAVATNYQALGLTEPPDFVRREIVNLRTLKTYVADDVWLADEDVDRWRRDIELLVAAHDAKPRIARPGLHCIGCEYAGVCEFAIEAARHPESREQVAIAYAAARARADELEAMARWACDEGVIETPDGVVGFVATDHRTALPDAWQTLWGNWTAGRTLDDATAGLARGFLAGLSWGVGQVEAAAKALLPTRKQAGERRALVESLTSTVQQRRFGVARKKPADVTDGERPQFHEGEP